MSSAAEIRSILERHLEDESDVKHAVLFGSMATGTEHAGSDVDLGIAGDTRFETNRLIELSTRLSLLCQREVQIRDLQRLEGLILSEVLQKGIIVKHDTVVYAGLMMRMLDYVEDLLPTVRRIREAQLGRFIHGS